MVFIAKPFLDDLAADMVHRVIPSGQITQGPEVAGFGCEFAADVGTPRAYAGLRGCQPGHIQHQP